MILSLNTSTTQFSVALLGETGSILAEYLITPFEKNFKTFTPSVNSLFADCGAEIKNLKAVVVALGPGSFTGLRVGLSMAKGIAQGLNIPIIGVSSLDAMASQLPFIRHPLCVLLSSRKGEVIFALFSWDDAKGISRLTEAQSVTYRDLAGVINEPAYFIGNNYSAQQPAIKELLGDNALMAPEHLWALRASSVGSIGLKRYFNGDFDNIIDLVPEYLRPPDIRPSPLI
jgi:tRNA threonylcarbamoyladenosine biosynthesis protein TsaB